MWIIWLYVTVVGMWGALPRCYLVVIWMCRVVMTAEHCCILMRVDRTLRSEYTLSEWGCAPYRVYHFWGCQAIRPSWCWSYRHHQIISRKTVYVIFSHVSSRLHTSMSESESRTRLSQFKLLTSHRGVLISAWLAPRRYPILYTSNMEMYQDMLNSARKGQGTDERIPTEPTKLSAEVVHDQVSFTLP